MGRGPGLLLPGDFDNDFDVDGADFLAWQRNTGLGSLSDWESKYGSGTLAAATTVPEPATWLLLLIGLGSVLYSSGSGRHQMTKYPMTKDFRSTKAFKP